MSAVESSVEHAAASAPRTLTVLGSTGSIGRSTLEVVAHQPDRFEIVALVGNRNVDLLAQQAIGTGAQIAVTADPELYGALSERLAGTGIAAAAGMDAVMQAARMPADLILAAIVGAAGLEPTLAAAEQGTTIALANKECLVCAGDVFRNALAQSWTWDASACSRFPGEAARHEGGDSNPRWIPASYRLWWRRTTVAVRVSLSSDPPVSRSA